MWLSIYLMIFIGSGMENKFDVLSPHFDCQISHFLEASAGTGKTFAIEHTVAKFLSLEKPLDLKDILVVTFTRSATSDLKNRIFEKLKKLSKEEQDFQKVCHLKKALARFEEANIYTIHGFCMQCLKEFAPFAGIALDLSFDEDESKEKKLVKDYLLYRLYLDDFSPMQINALFSFFRFDEDRLIDRCLNWVNKSRNIKKQPTFTEIFETYLQRVKKLSNVERLPLEFVENKKYFEKILNKKKQIKPEIIEEFEAFASFLSQKECSKEEFDRWVAKGDPISNHLKGLPPESSEVIKSIYEEVSSLIKLARNPYHLLARLVDGCLQLKNSIDDIGFWSPDDLLRVMHKSLENSVFLKKVKEKYKVAIIDEFQDTDPIQWEIFKKCFVDDPNTICYLVGDPKQSIYAFRRADIYTYLQAKHALKKGIKASLTTNYRSTKPLVDALNTLFCTTPWMPLPRLGLNLDVENVDAQKEGHLFLDDRGPLHFFITDKQKAKDAEDLYFSYIAKEIIALKTQNFSLSSIAILIKDRYQEARLATYLKEKGIEAQCKKGIALVESKGFLSLKRLFSALSDPEDIGKQTLCLIDPLFGYTLKELQNRDIKALMPALDDDKSISLFLDEVILKQSQMLLTKSEGLNHVRQLRQTYELILENIESKAREKDVEAFLEEAVTIYKNKIVATEDNEAVSIMTMHMSKGLEFDIVFALGATFRATKEDELIEDGQFLVPLDETLEAYKYFVEERDAEKARQLYVALTRAKKRVYVPVILYKDAEDEPAGTLSPIELFFKSHGVFGNSIIEKIDEWSKKTFITHDYLQDILEVPFFDPLSEKVNLKKPISPCIDHRRERILSYSSLAQHGAKTPFTGVKDFPSSAQVGILLHEIFEKEAFTTKALENLLFGTELFDYINQVKETVCLAITTPLKSNYSTIILNTIPKNRQIKEIEFLMDSDLAKSFLTGFIDLIIEHENRYYIIDWKSNLLNSYSQEALEEEMHKQSYLLQESLYREALKKYLKNFDKRPFEDCFGGSFYIFLRGLKEGGGVWYKS